jgi:hypothetical protein
MQFWMFQGHQQGLKVTQQEITELTNLTAGLLAFERAYLHTHGERTPVFRLISMINRAISEHADYLDREIVARNLPEHRRGDGARDFPF